MFRKGDTLEFIDIGSYRAKVGARAIFIQERDGCFNVNKKH